jgi:hypothetical protein
MRNLFKSKKKRLADLQRRTERIARIMYLSGARALDQDPELGKLIESPELQAKLKALESLTLDQAESFIAMLESGVPEEFRGIA